LFLAAVIFLAAGIFSAPDTLLRFDLMENALHSDSELIRKGARLEILGARVLALGTAAVLFVLVPFWSRIEASARYRAFVGRERKNLRANRAAGRRHLRALQVGMMAAIGFVVLWIVAADSVLTRKQLHLVHREDGIIETASALFLLCAAVVSVRIAWKLGRGRPEYYMHLFLGLLFFVMFGEEISWGQRYFGLTTPEFIAAVNVQEEINFHNMYGYLFDHIFVFCFLVWGVVVPLLDHVSRFFRQVFLAIGLPVPSAGLAVAMLLISLMQSDVVYLFTDPLPTLRIPEAREVLSALALLVLMLEIRVLVGGSGPLVPRNRATGTGAGAPANSGGRH
jgi:hypothetical protein